MRNMIWNGALAPLLTTIALAACVWGLTSGCAMHTGAGPSDGTLRFIETTVTEAAYIGVSLDLDENPAHAAQYRVVGAALAALVQDTNYSQVELARVLLLLPAIHGSQGKLVEAGAWLFTVAVGYIPIDDAPRVGAVIRGLQAGIAAALDRTSTAAKSKAPLRTVCKVPPRK